MKFALPVNLIIALFFTLGCATHPDKISATYVSPVIYKNHDDDQIIAEMAHIGRRTSELYNSLKKEANNDSVQMGVGLLLFWPTLFFLEGGDGPEAAEYARLKGEYEALRKIAVQRKLDPTIIPPSPEEIVKKYEQENESSRPGPPSKRSR